MNRSYSQFSTFALCPRKHVLGRKYESKVKATALAEGDIFHLCLGKMYAQGDADAGLEVFKVTREQYLKDAKEGGASTESIERMIVKFASLEAMLKAYREKIFPGDMARYDILAVEKSFDIKVARGLRLRGYVDGIWRDKSSGVRFIMEHKYKTSHEEDLMHLDLQVSLYTAAMIEEYGPLPTFYNVALKPQNRMKKNETHHDFVTRIYTDVTEKMTGFLYSPGDFACDRFVRKTYSRGKTELKAAIDQITSMDRVMRRVEKHPELAWRNVGDHCLWLCSFRPVCIDEDPMDVNRLYELKQRMEPKKESV